MEVAFRKPIEGDEGLLGYVEIDACTFEADTGGFHENAAKKLPFSLCGSSRYVRTVAFNSQSVAYVPRKPLLFLYKLKAFRDRTHDLRARGHIMSAERREWMRTKIEKDGADMIALLNPKPHQHVIDEVFDYKLLKDLVEHHGLTFALESIEQLPRRDPILRRHPSIRNDEIEHWIECFYEKIQP
jgi:hypothetical protein